MRTLLLVTAVLVLASSAVFAADMPKGSFLNTPVDGVGALVQQVMDDAIVAARYARHFGTSRNLVVGYFKENLQPAKLTEDYECTMYVLTSRTDAEGVKKVLPKGTYVFATPGGHPLLDGATGNPLTDSMPITLTSSVRKAATAKGSAGSSAGDSVVTKVLNAPPSEIGASSATVAGAIEGGPLTAVTAPVTATEPVVEMVSAIPIRSEGGSFLGKSGSSLLPIAALAGGLAMVGGGGGGGADRTGGTVDTMNPVPEPASLAVLVFGVSGLAGGKLLRKRA